MPLTDEQRKGGRAEIKSTPAEDAVKAAEMATKDLDYDMTSAERAAAGFDRADPDFDRSPTVGTTLSNSTACYREIVRKRVSPISLSSYF